MAASKSNPDIEYTAAALRQMRIGKNLSQTEVTRRGGPDFRTISHWETNRKLPTLRGLFRLLSAMDLNLHDFQDALDQVARRRTSLDERFAALEQRIRAVEKITTEIAGKEL